MNSGPRNPAAGQGSHSQIVTLFLVAVGIGIAAFVFFAHQRDDGAATDSTEAFREPMAIEQHLLGELAKKKNRSLSDEQVAGLREALSPKRGERISIECTLGDLESCYLALEIDLIFEASGWIVEEFLFATRTTPGKAVILRARDESLRARAEFLADLFRSSGLTVTTEIDGAQPFDLRIIVPTKKTPSTQDTPA